jgi:hypothetical protein
MLLGVHLTLYIGPTIAVPAPIALTEALSGVEVTQNEEGRSGFSLTFQVGRSGPFDILDYNLLTNPLLIPYNRVVVQVWFTVTPTVLLDGVITHVQLTPSEEPGASTLTVSGEDVSRMMDLEEHTDSYPNQSELLRLTMVLLKYPEFGILPDVTTPTVPDQTVSTMAIRKQNDTDYGYILDMAGRCGFTFYLRPGFLPNSNVAYFGPKGQPDLVARAFPPPALSVNMGPQTNVDSINFDYDATAFEQVVTTRSEPLANLSIPIMSVPISTDTPLALIPPVAYQLGKFRKTRADQPLTGMARRGDNPLEHPIPDGQMVPLALAHAQGRTNASSQKAVTASGELDGLRYGAVLHARSTVDLRGVGATFDGRYYVQSVTHSISKGQYKQRFSIRRSGVYPLSPLVRV